MATRKDENREPGLRAARGEDEHSHVKSSEKRSERGLTRLSARLIACLPRELKPLPLSDELRAAIEVAQNIRANVARKRQLQYVRKMLRGDDADAIEAALDGTGDSGHSATDELFSELVPWRTRILEQGDPALEEFMAAAPGADRQRLRQRARAARRAEPGSDKAKRAAKRLLAALRDAAETTPQ